MSNLSGLSSLLRWESNILGNHTHSLSSLDHAVFWANVMGSFFACVCCAISSRKVLPYFRPLLITMSVMSSIYCLGYLGIYGHVYTVDNWSRIFRGFSLVAWICPWMIVGRILVKFTEKVKEEARQKMPDFPEE